MKSSWLNNLLNCYQFQWTNLNSSIEELKFNRANSLESYVLETELFSNYHTRTRIDVILVWESLLKPLNLWVRKGSSFHWNYLVLVNILAPSLYSSPLSKCKKKEKLGERICKEERMFRFKVLNRGSAERSICKLM